MPTGVKIAATPEQLAGVKYDANGLVPAIAQDIRTKDVLMVAWMNAETLRLTLDEGRMVYWSRSRQEVWRKGDTSGDGQYVQEERTGQVLMMAWMTPETLLLTLEEGRTVFWSRSRQEVWRKGETSGERQWVRSAFYDCDGDTLLFVVDQDGAGACHTGQHSCFFRQFGTAAVGGS